LPNPKLAPYGVSCLEVLGTVGLTSKRRNSAGSRRKYQSKTYQVLPAKNGRLGFVALSQIIGNKGQLSSGSAGFVPYYPTLYCTIKTGNLQ